tara:strand:- start:7725 stop:7991 length:267 start_codon:yes stop_codon:yes gene_type:complete
MEAKNQHQQVIWYLINWDEFSLMDLINDSMFIKFQTRLSEIENEVSCFIAERTRVEFTNRFKRKSTYNKYKACIPKEKLIELFNRYEK